MNETSKSRKIWTSLEFDILKGEGIDIGCGRDLVAPTAQPFDLQQGDANDIGRHVQRKFDYVFSSHTLEHMRDPHQALAGWWELVREGGHMIIQVPDEDLYEQGHFPSLFNNDHKWTFTIGKNRSWCEKSVNVVSLVTGLPNAKLLKLELQDNGYDRCCLRHGAAFCDQTLGGALAQIEFIVQKLRAD